VECREQFNEHAAKRENVCWKAAKVLLSNFWRRVLLGTGCLAICICGLQALVRSCDAEIRDVHLKDVGTYSTSVLPRFPDENILRLDIHMLNEALVYVFECAAQACKETKRCIGHNDPRSFVDRSIVKDVGVGGEIVVGDWIYEDRQLLLPRIRPDQTDDMRVLQSSEMSDLFNRLSFREVPVGVDRLAR
jgi:hypothetical protein